MQRASRDGNRELIFEEMKKAKYLLIWSSSNKFAQGTRTTKKVKAQKKKRRKTNMDVN
jgi:hypothetical protein